MIGIFSLIRRDPDGAREVEMDKPTPGFAPKLKALAIFTVLVVIAIGIGLAVTGPDGLRLLGLVAFSTVTSFGEG